MKFVPLKEIIALYQGQLRPEFLRGKVVRNIQSQELFIADGKSLAIVNCYGAPYKTEDGEFVKVGLLPENVEVLILGRYEEIKDLILSSPVLGSDGLNSMSNALQASRLQLSGEAFKRIREIGSELSEIAEQLRSEGVISKMIRSEKKIEYGVCPEVFGTPPLQAAVEAIKRIESEEESFSPGPGERDVFGRLYSDIKKDSPRFIYRVTKDGPYKGYYVQAAYKSKAEEVFNKYLESIETVSRLAYEELRSPDLEYVMPYKVAFIDAALMFDGAKIIHQSFE